jgi:hypothetical protein
MFQVQCRVISNALNLIGELKLARCWSLRIDLFDFSFVFVLKIKKIALTLELTVKSVSITNKSSLL